MRTAKTDHIHESSLEPATFLVENMELLPRGRVLDVAMGSGRNAIFMAKAGYEVEGVDRSPEAVNMALEAAREAGVNIKAQVADLEGEYEISKEAYEVIICFNYLQRSLIPQISEGLRTRHSSATRAIPITCWSITNCLKCSGNSAACATMKV